MALQGINSVDKGLLPLLLVMARLLRSSKSELQKNPSLRFSEVPKLANLELGFRV